MQPSHAPERQHGEAPPAAPAPPASPPRTSTRPEISQPAPPPTPPSGGPGTAITTGAIVAAILLVVLVGGLYAIARSKVRAAEGAERVVVADVEMPFWSMVVFMVKWAIAAIPAMLILMAIAMLVFLAFASAIVGAVAAMLR